MLEKNSESCRRQHHSFVLMSSSQTASSILDVVSRSYGKCHLPPQQHDPSHTALCCSSRLTENAVLWSDARSAFSPLQTPSKPRLIPAPPQATETIDTISDRPPGTKFALNHYRSTFSSCKPLSLSSSHSLLLCRGDWLKIVIESDRDQCCSKHAWW